MTSGWGIKLSLNGNCLRKQVRSPVDYFVMLLRQVVFVKQLHWHLARPVPPKITGDILTCLACDT